MIIDPIDGTEEFSARIPTFGTFLGIDGQRNCGWEASARG